MTKRARELVLELESDLGRADQLTVAERELIKRAALCGALAEDLKCVGYNRSHKPTPPDQVKLNAFGARPLATCKVDQLEAFRSRK
jgi:hypothetical protein